MISNSIKVLSSLLSCTAGVIVVLMTVILSCNLVSYSIAAPVVSKTTTAQVRNPFLFKRFFEKVHH